MEGGECWLVGRHGACLDIDGTRTVRMSQKRSGSAKWTITSASGGGDQHYLMASNKCFLAVTSKGEQSFCLSPITEKFAVWTLKPTSGLEGEYFLASFHGTFLASLNDAEQTLYMSPNAEDWEKWRCVPCKPAAPAAQLTVALEAGGGAQPGAIALVDAVCRHDLSALRGLFAVAATAGCVLETSGPVDADGNTLLHKCSVSSMQGSSTDTEQVLELLAGHGAAINAPNVLGETPLLSALRATAAQSVVRKLLNMRADPNHGDNLTGDTALMEAACGGDAAMCQLLLEAKADPSRQNFQGLTALDLAEAAGQDNLVALPGLSAAPPDSPDLDDAGAEEEEPEQQDENTAEARAELQQHCQLRGVPLEALGEHGADEVLRELARLETLRMDELRRECQSWNLQAEHCYQRLDLVARLQQFFTWQAMPLATLTGEAQTRALQLLRKPGEKDAPLAREELLEALVVATWGGATKGQKLSDGRARGIPVDSLESPEQAAKLMEQLERLEKGSVSGLKQEYLKRGFATRSGAGKEELMVCLKDALVWEVLPVTHLRQVCRRRNLKVGRGEQSREELMELLANATWEDRGIPRQRLPSLVVAQGVLSSVEGFESKSVADVEAFCRKKGLPVEHRPDHQVLVGRVRDMLVWENLPAGELVKECQRRGVSTVAAAEGSQDHSGRGPASPGFRHHNLSMPSPFFQTRFSWKGEEERLLGKWCYGSKSTEYSISRTDNGHLCFCGPHAKSGLVSGALQLLGHWWQGLLVSVDGKSVGSIRLRHTMEDDTITSQFKSAGKEEWGKDVVAKKVEDPARLAALRLVGRWTYGTKQTEYCVDLEGDVRLRFTGPHSRTGTVSGVLEPRGEWFQAELTSQSGEMVGSIRLRSLEEGNRSISNFRSANMEEWGKDIVANKVGGGVGTAGEKARAAGPAPEGLADHRTLVQRLVQAAHKSMKETRGVQPERFATEEEAEEVFNHILELEQMSDSALRHEHERLNLPVIGNMTWQQVFEAVRLWCIWGKLSLEELEKECAAAARSGDLPSTPSSHTAARVEPVPIRRMPTGPRGGRGLAGKGRALGVMPSNLPAAVSCFKGGHGRGFQPLRVNARVPTAQVLPSSAPQRSPPSASQPGGPAATQGAPTSAQQSNTAEPSEERRLDPHDGVMRTLRQMREWYRGEFSEDEVLKYWDSTCKEATKSHIGLSEEGRRTLLKERLLDAFCVRVYESKGIPARRLSNVAAARRVQERFVRLERMNVEDLWKEVTKTFTPSPKESDKLVLLRRLKQSTVWQELPLEELRQEARKVGLQMSSMASSQEIIQGLVRKSWHQERARQPAAPKPQPRPQPKKAVPPKPKLPLDPSKMMKDFERLGLPRTANAAEIRTAYRKLALKYHPDKNPGEAQEAAAVKFREVTAAYEALCGYMRKMEVQ